MSCYYALRANRGWGCDVFSEYWYLRKILISITYLWDSSTSPNTPYISFASCWVHLSTTGYWPAPASYQSNYSVQQHELHFHWIIQSSSFGRFDFKLSITDRAMPYESKPAPCSSTRGRLWFIWHGPICMYLKLDWAKYYGFRLC